MLIRPYNWKIPNDSRRQPEKNRDAYARKNTTKTARGHNDGENHSCITNLDDFWETPRSNARRVGCSYKQLSPTKLSRPASVGTQR